MPRPFEAPMSVTGDYIYSDTESSVSSKVETSEQNEEVDLERLIGAFKEALNRSEQMIANFEKQAAEIGETCARLRNHHMFEQINSKVRKLGDNKPKTGLLRCGSLEINLDSFECRSGGAIVVLSVLEFNLLRFFMENVGRVLSRENILQAVWKGAVVGKRTIDTHMTSLRKKVRNSSISFVTLYGAGYVLKDCPATKGALSQVL